MVRINRIVRMELPWVNGAHAVRFGRHSVGVRIGTGDRVVSTPSRAVIAP
jgi:hypothetical protein